MKSVFFQRMKLTPWLWGALLVLVISVVMAAVSDVIISKAEVRLAYTKIAFDSNRDGNRDIYLMNPYGTNLQRLTNHPLPDEYPCWSPDGKNIAFSSTRDGNEEIYVMNADGTNPIRLTNHPAADISPSWSPDGKNIAFVSMRDGDYQIYVMNADGTNPVKLTNPPGESKNPSWSPVDSFVVSPRAKLSTTWGEIRREGKK